MSKLNVVVVPVQGKPEVREIENDYKAMQSLVGGLIEFFPLTEELVIICDEEAKLKSKLGNRLVNGQIIAGDFFVAAEGGESIKSLEEHHIAFLKKRFSIPELFSNAEVEDSIQIEVVSW